MVNRNSKAYIFGRFVGRVILLSVGYVVGKRWSKKPIDKSPDKK